MNLRTSIFILSFNLNLLCLSQYWTEIAPFEGSSRDDAVSFVIGNRSYCGTGLEVGWNPTRDFYAFDFSNENWFPVANLPIGAERQYATGFSHGGNGYVFGGVKNGVFLNDFFEYNPVNNEWTSKDSMPSIGRSGCSHFIINEKVYIIGGINNLNQITNEVWSYNFNTSLWNQENDFPFGGRFRGVACSYNNKGYFLFGRDENNLTRNELYVYDPSLELWALFSTFPIIGRTYSSLNVFNDKLVMTFGMDSTGLNYNDVWSFDIISNLWTQEISLPALKRRGGLMFASSNSLYYTTGIDENNNRLNETWKLTDFLIGNLEFKLDVNIERISQNIYLVKNKTNKEISLNLTNVLSALVWNNNFCQDEIIIDLNNYLSGIFFLNVNNEKIIKIFKE